MPNYFEFDHQREYEWLVMPQSYFEFALIGARILNKKLQSNEIAIRTGSPLDYCLKEIYGDYPQSPEYLIFPILYNFKHGIELYLKVLLGIPASKFPKGHDLICLFTQTGIQDKKIQEIIVKYSLCNLLLKNNKENDRENQFERYPQGNPYDSLGLFPAITKTGQVMKIPERLNYGEVVKWMVNNNAEIKSVITRKTIEELIADIEFVYGSLRDISIKQDIS